MKKKHQTAVGELVATSCGNHVQIYGRSLEEICRRHRNAIKKTTSYDLKAIEEGKYAVFLLLQFQNFARHKQPQTVNQIISLFENAINTLADLENRERSKYRHIIQDFRHHLKIACQIRQLYDQCNF